MAIRLNADGTSVNVAPATGASFTLPELQAIVGGYIEAIYFRGGAILFCNEHGKQLNLPYNDAATSLAREWAFLPADDYIVGDVVVGTRQEMGGE